MKRFYVLALLMCLTSFGYTQLDCSTFTLRDAKETALFLYLPTYTGCSTEPTYEISYRPDVGGPWVNVTQVFYYPYGSPANSFFFFGLDACTDYDVRVKVFCNGVEVGECIETFSTKGCAELDCNDVSLGNIGTTTADITLSNQAGCADLQTGEITYKLRYKKSADSWGPFVTGQTTSGVINLTGLDACTDYDYEIRLICNGAPTTICAASFTTLCGSCSGITAANIGDTSADILLNGFDDCKDGGALNYDFRYRESGGSWISSTGQVNSTGMISLTGLSLCTIYEYEITVKCNGEEVLCSGSFTTTGCEVYPCSGVDVPYHTNTLAYIRFTGFEDCERFGGYSVEYWLINNTTGAAVWNSSSLGQNFFVLQNLDPCTEYTVELTIICDGIPSNMCPVTFTTDGPCLTSGSGAVKKNAASDEKAVSAFPNPFTNELTLEFGMEMADEVTIRLHDVLGKEVYRTSGNFQSGLNRFVVKGENLPSGLLFYSLTSGSMKKSGRVIKQ